MITKRENSESRAELVRAMSSRERGRALLKDSIETAYSFLHQKRNVYIHSTLEWQKDDIEFAIASYVDDMSQELYEAISDGRADYFIKLCQQCGNYGRRYGCPPFDEEPLTAIEGYDTVRILGVKITPTDMSLPLEAANDLMKPVISELNEELLETEKLLSGMCYGFVGTCPYCGGAACARIDGKPCKHPDKVRPSLEAIGFDISKTAKDLLGLEIKWSQDGVIPEYLTLVCGIFYKKH